MIFLILGLTLRAFLIVLAIFCRCHLLSVLVSLSMGLSAHSVNVEHESDSRVPFRAIYSPATDYLWVYLCDNQSAENCVALETFAGEP